MDVPRDNTTYQPRFLARQTPQNQQSPALQSRTNNDVAGGSAAQHSQGAASLSTPLSTGNSVIFQRRQRRRIEQQHTTSQQIERLQVPPVSARRPTNSRKDSDAWSWIRMFLHSGQELQPSIFNILLDRPDIMLHVTRWLDIEDIISMFAISKDFHLMMNTQMTTMVLGNARSRAPESADIFTFQCYQSICIYDPAQNLNEERPDMIRNVPGLKWLRFIHFREATVDSIIKSLAAKGHRLPRYASKVIKKIWFLMDVPDTKRRIGIIHNPELWSDVDLYIACMFFMKFDMACTHPIDGKGERGIRRLLLAQRSLSKMDAVLKREEMQDTYELLQMHVEWKVNKALMPAGMLAGNTVFNVPLDDCGRLGCENWIPGLIKLMRPDEIIMKESLRRRLNFKEKLIDLVLWGNIHPVTHEDVFPKNKKGEIETCFDDVTERLALDALKVYASRGDTQADSNLAEEHEPIPEEAEQAGEEEEKEEEEEGEEEEEEEEEEDYEEDSEDEDYDNEEDSRNGEEDEDENEEDD